MGFPKKIIWGYRWAIAKLSSPRFLLLSRTGAGRAVVGVLRSSVWGASRSESQVGVGWPPAVASPGTLL